MTTFEVGTAFGAGMARERDLLPERDSWTREQWLQRKVFLEDLIDEEIAEHDVDDAEVARLKGRLAIVCLEGQTRFGR